MVDRSRVRAEPRNARRSPAHNSANNSAIIRSEAVAVAAQQSGEVKVRRVSLSPDGVPVVHEEPRPVILTQDTSGV